MTLCVTPKEEQQFRKKYILNFDCLCEAREIKGKLELYNKKFFCCFVLCQLSPYRKKLLYIKRKSYLYNIVHGDSTSIWKQVIPSHKMFANLVQELSNEIGVFANLTNTYCLTAFGGSENFYRFVATYSIFTLICLKCIWKWTATQISYCES